MSELEVSTKFKNSVEMKFDNEFKKQRDSQQQLKNLPDKSRILQHSGRQHRFRLLRALLYTDATLIFFTSLCYGIFPCGFRRHSYKCKYLFISIALATMHWFCFASYVYFICVYWSDSRYGVEMPLETKTIMIGLLASAACTYSLATVYFYSSKNNFTCGNQENPKFSIFPRFEFRLPGKSNGDLNIGPTENDWFHTNIFLFLGFFSSSWVIFVDFHYNAFFDFVNNHGFLGTLSSVEKLHYHLSVSTGFFGFYATACTVCIYHIITRNLIRHIEKTEDFILNEAKDRADFQEALAALQSYGKKLLQSLKWWFNVHTLFFFFLVSAMIFGWIKIFEKADQNTTYFNKLLLSQIGGSTYIAFKFSFPFLSASQITTRYNVFYYRIARNCKIVNLPELSILHSDSGIKMFGIRITSNFAVTALFLSFLGALKIITFSSSDKSRV